MEGQQQLFDTNDYTVATRSVLVPKEPMSFNAVAKALDLVGEEFGSVNFTTPIYAVEVTYLPSREVQVTLRTW